MTKTLQEIHQFCHISLLGFVIPSGNLKKMPPPQKKNQNFFIDFLHVLGHFKTFSKKIGILAPP